MRQFQQGLDVIGNNIANVNTTGFKGARVTFEDALSQTVGSTAEAPMQVGTGVNTSAITNLFRQGVISQTGNTTDLAISGDGFFVVRDAVSDQSYATRDGAFQLDSQGYLVTSRGLRVQGFADAALSSRGDVRIDNTGAPGGSTAAVKSFTVDTQGRVIVQLEDGTTFTRGQVLLQRFVSPQALTKEGNNLYSGLASAGPLAQTEAPGTNGLGAVLSGALEMSNVDLAAEFSSMITTQRAFQASARLITTSDEILMELINLKR